MNQAILLHVMFPLQALDATAEYVTIPADSVIEITEDLAGTGYLQVQYLGEILLVFTQDIQERTRQVSPLSV